MVGFEMFCERCGKRYGNGEASNSGSLPLSKRLLKVVGVSASAPQAQADEPLLRFCLACRGYACPECWNDDSGFCQTCVPLEEAVVEMPMVDIPALDLPVVEHPHVHTPTPAIAFAEPPPETDNWLDARLESVAAMSVLPEAEPAAESEHAAEPVAAIEADEPELELEAVVESPDPVVASPEPVVVEATVVTAADAAIDVAAVVKTVESAETFVLDERPIELVFAEEEVAETEPEMAWDWDFVAETEAAPLAADSAESVVEPSEPAGLVEAPVIPARPEVIPAPVYHPLPSLGPIVPPPPPAAAGATPHMAFDLLEPPPAFVIAPPQAQAMMRPTLPAGLFDGPAPQIRPCPQCELPVSAKARFCRRCGSAQS